MERHLTHLVTCCQDSTTVPHVTSPSAFCRGRVKSHGTTVQQAATETRVSRHTLMTYDSRQLNFGGQLAQLHFDGVKRRGSLRRIEKSLGSLEEAYVCALSIAGTTRPSIDGILRRQVCLVHGLTIQSSTHSLARAAGWALWARSFSVLASRRIAKVTWKGKRSRTECLRAADTCRRVREAAGRSR